MNNFRREIKAALREDRVWHDRTTRTFVPARLRASAVIVSKQAGVLSGVRAAAETFRLRDPRCRTSILVHDGKTIRRGRAVLRVEGPLSSLLSAERTALNFVTHLSGVATLTREFVRRLGRAGPQLLDTRKTLPGLRRLQRWAVVCGGGTNHRLHLAEAILIKENHIAAVRGKKALRAFFRNVKALRRRGMKVEMECHTQKDIVWALLAGADILLLDNFPPRLLPKVVRWIRQFCV
ncbi:MAG TPA: carboxylating nicotinate-nucleotide diphosphorylase, partial [Elusimicrobiota bacterium]|nr:carboxylating nicotinate-nucleotide diphosphorylase [Elusimicrobiota bacterium]